MFIERVVRHHEEQEVSLAVRFEEDLGEGDGPEVLYPGHPVHVARPVLEEEPEDQGGPGDQVQQVDYLRLQLLQKARLRDRTRLPLFFVDFLLLILWIL